MRGRLVILTALLLVSCGRQPVVSSASGLRTTEEARSEGSLFQPMYWRAIAPLNEPREGHILLYAGGELTAFGGHTTGFVASQTAEYYRHGRWHYAAPMTYTHDGAFAAQLPDGRIMLGGGCGEDFGIGQSWGVETYDPRTREFIPLEGIMDSKRAFASALALPDGRVLVSGNWYAGDAISIWTEENGFLEVKPVTVNRIRPFIIPGADDDVFVFASRGSWDEEIPGIVDRLNGEPLTPELFEQWSISPGFTCLIPDSFRIGDTFFFMVERKSDGQMAVATLQDGDFSLLETDLPFPMTTPRDKVLEWIRTPLADSSRNLLWLWGTDRDGRLYFAKVDLNSAPAAISFYMAEGVEGGFPSVSSVVLTPEGNLLFTGGIGDNNFFPVADCRVFSDKPIPAPFPWGWVIGGLALILLGVFILWLLRHRRHPADVPSEKEAESEAAPSLEARIVALMESERLYLQKDLRLRDVAMRLGTNVTYVSAAMNGPSVGSFSAFVNGYRIRHAQQLMRQNPGMAISEVIEESGFSSESAFYHHFKRVAGCTPGEWMAGR